MTSRKFKDPRIQEVYDVFLFTDPGPETRGQGVAHNAYYLGRYVSRVNSPLAPRGTLAYGAWCAGADNYRRAQRKLRT